MAATGELIATGDQSLAISRIAALALRLADGGSAWTTAAAARFFHSALDDAQREVCIRRDEGHRIEPWLMAGRAEAVTMGLAPAHVRAAQAAIAATGSVWGLRETIPPVVIPRDADVVLVHEATERSLTPGSVPAARRLLEATGLTVADLPIVSSGVAELELGLVDDARRAATAAMGRVGPGGDVPLVGGDPPLVAMLRAGGADPDRPFVGRIEHVLAILRDRNGARSPGRGAAPAGDTDRQGPQPAGSVVVHDPGLLSRRLGLAGAVRDLLAGLADVTVSEAPTFGRSARSDGGIPAALGDPVGVAVARMRVEELGRARATSIITVGPVACAALRVGGGTRIGDLVTFLDEHRTGGGHA